MPLYFCLYRAISFVLFIPFSFRLWNALKSTHSTVSRGAHFNMPPQVLLLIETNILSISATWYWYRYLVPSLIARPQLVLTGVLGVPGTMLA